MKPGELATMLKVCGHAMFEIIDYMHTKSNCIVYTLVTMNMDWWACSNIDNTPEW